MPRKSTMVELVVELEKLEPRTPLVETMIEEAKAGEYHDYKNKKYTCGKVEAVRKLRLVGTPEAKALMDQIMEGEYDEPADDEDKEMMRRDIDESTTDPREAAALKEVLGL